jgi:hypothetical protein
MRTAIQMALVSSGLLACSSDPGRAASYQDASVYYYDAGPYPLVDEAMFARAMADARDERDGRCCAQLDLVLTSNSVPEPVPDPGSGVRFDPAAAAACVAETARAACELEKATSAAPEACRHVYEGGRRAQGEPCLSNWECSPGDTPGAHGNCSVSLGKGGVWQQGVCYEFRAAEEGEDCSPADSLNMVECKWPLICSPETNVCVQRPTLGQTCITGSAWGDTCGPGSVCDRQQSDRCVMPKAIGEVCSALEECESLACIGGRCRAPLFVAPLCSP